MIDNYLRTYCETSTLCNDIGVTDANHNYNNTNYDNNSFENYNELSNNMKYVRVKFKGSSKIYTYQTNLNLIKGGIYSIIADKVTQYNNPVEIIDYVNSTTITNIRTITDATLIKGPMRPDDNIKNIYINEQKGTVVIAWKDNKKTKVKCHPEDVFDAEKGIALCYMKRFFNNRGCYNEVFKKYIER